MGQECAHELKQTGRGSWVDARDERDGAEYHITVAHKSELQPTELPGDGIRQKIADLDPTSPWVDLGLGFASHGTSTAAFSVVCWPHAAAWRALCGLPGSDLHITAGFDGSDVHGRPKGLVSLSHPRSSIDAALVADVVSSAEAVFGQSVVCAALIPIVAQLLHAVECVPAPARAVLCIRVLRLACKVNGKAKRFDAVVRFATEGLELANGDASLLWMCGWAYTRLQQDKDALVFLERAAVAVAATDLTREAATGGDGDAARTGVELARVKLALRECRGRLGEIPPLHKFPRTAHLFDAGGHAVTADDLLVGADDLSHFYGSGAVVIAEEKVDGANLGVSIGPNFQILFQNRAHYVNDATHTQFSGLSRWGEQHSTVLHALLQPERHVLFGEWCALKHSILYTRLPAYFVAFDLYDRETATMATRAQLHQALAGTGIPTVPVVAKRVFRSREELIPLLDTLSCFREEGPVEGVYLRVESGLPTQHRRCKLVRPDFVQGITKHWMGEKVVKNTVDVEVRVAYLDQCYTEAAIGTTTVAATAD